MVLDNDSARELVRNLYGSRLEPGKGVPCHMVSMPRTVAVAVVALFVARGSASAVPAQDCASRKIDAAGEKANRKLNCIEDATREGVAVDPACLQQAEDRYLADFADAEMKALDHCLTLDDAGAVESLVDAFVSDVDAGLVVAAGPDACAAQKLQAAREKAEGKLTCYAATVKGGKPADQDCLRFKDQKFSKKFSGAETRYTCNTTGDEAAVEDQVDAFVGQIVDALPGGSALCTGGKLHAAGVGISLALKCYQKPAKTGDPLDPECLAKADDKLLGGLDKSDAKGPCPGDTFAVASAAGLCVDALVASLLDTGACTVAKLAAAGLKASNKFKCLQKAALKSVFDPACFAKAEERFAALFAKADGKGPCVGDAAVVESLIDDCVDSIAALVPLLPPSSPSGAFIDG